MVHRNTGYSGWQGWSGRRYLELLSSTSWSMRVISSIWSVGVFSFSPSGVKFIPINRCQFHAETFAGQHHPLYQEWLSSHDHRVLFWREDMVTVATENQTVIIHWEKCINIIHHDNAGAVNQSSVTWKLLSFHLGLSTSLDPQVSHTFISLFIAWILIQ